MWWINKIKENSYTVRHLNNGTDHRHSKSCCDQSSPARRTTMKTCHNPLSDQNRPDASSIAQILVGVWHFMACLQHYSDVMMSATASHITNLAIVYSTVYPGANQRKHQNSASLAFVRGIHRWPVNSPHKGPVTRKMFPFDDVIMSAAYSFLKHVDSWRDMRYLGAHKTCHSVGSWQHPWLKQVGILHIIRSFNWNRKTDDVKLSLANIVIKRDPS